MGVAQHRGQLPGLHAGEAREAAASQDDVVLEVNEPEHGEPPHGALERAASPAAGAEAEHAGGVVDGEAESGRAVLEPVGEPSGEERGARPEQRQPEHLRVPAARIVAELVEDGIGPRADVEHLGSRTILDRRCCHVMLFHASPCPVSRPT